VLLLLVNGQDCSKKEQKLGFFTKIRLGATYSQEMGCTSFGLLNRIRAQGATGQKKTGAPADGFPGETSVINARGWKPSEQTVSFVGVSHFAAT
jgi:hypothetical protein